MTTPGDSYPADPVEEKILRRIPFEIVALSAVIALGVALLFDPMSGLIFLAGGILAAVSFLWMKRALGKVLAREKAGAIRAGAALYALRFALIVGAFLLVILAYPSKLLAFAAGFSTLLPVFLVEAVVALLRMRTWKV